MYARTTPRRPARNTTSRPGTATSAANRATISLKSANCGAGGGQRRVPLALEFVDPLAELENPHSDQDDAKYRKGASKLRQRDCDDQPADQEAYALPDTPDALQAPVCPVEAIGQPRRLSTSSSVASEEA